MKPTFSSPNIHSASLIEASRIIIISRLPIVISNPFSKIKNHVSSLFQLFHPLSGSGSPSLYQLRPAGFQSRYRQPWLFCGPF